MDVCYRTGTKGGAAVPSNGNAQLAGAVARSAVGTKFGHENGEVTASVGPVWTICQASRHARMTAPSTGRLIRGSLFLSGAKAISLPKITPQKLSSVNAASLSTPSCVIA